MMFCLYNGDSKMIGRADFKSPACSVENIGPGFVIASIAKQSQTQRWLFLLITQEIATALRASH